MTREETWKNFRRMQLVTGLVGIAAVFLPVVQFRDQSGSAWDALTFVVAHFSELIQGLQLGGKMLAMSPNSGGRMVSGFFYLALAAATFLSMITIGLDRLIRWYREGASSGLLHAIIAAVSVLVIFARAGFQFIGYAYWIWVVVALAGPVLYYVNRDAIEKYADGHSDSWSSSSSPPDRQPQRSRSGPSPSDSPGAADGAVTATSVGVHDYECGHCGGVFAGKLNFCEHCGSKMRYE